VSRLADLECFYELVHECGRRLGGPRRMAVCSGRLEWPKRGVYFFFEPNEVRRDTGSGARIIRVGTHALKTGSTTTLWNRLAQHRGPRATRSGNHRGSIFRLLVGAALIRQRALECSTWGCGSSAPRDVRKAERPLEEAVSDYIGRMDVIWLEVPDEPGPASLRGVIERNAIALLSNARQPALDPPSVGWLGWACPRPLVSEAGLWNQNHVQDEYDRSFLEQFASLVREDN